MVFSVYRHFIRTIRNVFYILCGREIHLQDKIIGYHKLLQCSNHMTNRNHYRIVEKIQCVSTKFTEELMKEGVGTHR